MTAPKTLRHQQFNRPSKEFFPQVAEQPLSLSVDQSDVPFLIGHHDGIRRGFQERPELALCLPALLFSPFAVGDFAVHRRDQGA
jgi:hypothetical protein